jgi:hypothetical protein
MSGSGQTSGLGTVRNYRRYLTGYGQESDLRLSQAAGFNVHLAKPVGFQRLRDLQSTLLSPPAKSLEN